MKTSAKSRRTAEEIDAFLGFKLRIESLEFFGQEIQSLQARGEEILAELARLRPTGDPLKDARVRAGWEEMLEETFEAYGAALDKLGWEMENSGQL